MASGGVTYPCAWCFGKTAGVIKLAAFDVDETPADMGIRLNGKPPLNSTELVCAKCLRKDRATRVEADTPVAEKLLKGPGASTVRAALRAGSLPEDDDDEEAEEEIRLTEKILKPLEEHKKLKKDKKTFKKPRVLSSDPPEEAKEDRKKKRKW